MPTRRLIIAAALCATPSLAAARSASSPDAFSFSFPGLEGGTVDLSAYRGRPILVVNTASRCGFTPQYEGLQQLWTRYRERGLVVIGVPSNDFGQELAGAKDIAGFCSREFGVTFPLTAPQAVRGGNAHPFYRWAHAERGEAPRWNFHKYLIGRDGRIAASFPSEERPTGPRIVAAVERALQPAPTN